MQTSDINRAKPHYQIDHNISAWKLRWGLALVQLSSLGHYFKPTYSPFYSTFFYALDTLLRSRTANLTCVAWPLCCQVSALLKPHVPHQELMIGLPRLLSKPYCLSGQTCNLNGNTVINRFCHSPIILVIFIICTWRSVIGLLATAE